MSPLFTRNMKHAVSDTVTSPINHDAWYRKKQSVAINDREFGKIKLMRLVQLKSRMMYHECLMIRKKMIKNHLRQPKKTVQFPPHMSMTILGSVNQ